MASNMSPKHPGLCQGSAWRLCFLCCFLWVLAPEAVAAEQAEGTSRCKMSLAQGFLDVRRAQYESALELFKEALLGGGDCLVEAHLGLATTYNAMNDHKRALEAAKTALLYAEDKEVLAEIHYQIGLAYDHRGKKMDKKKAQAVESFERVLELVEGEHPGAIRSLLRIHKEVKDTARVAALEAKYPGYRVATRAEQRRTVRTTRRAPKAAEEVQAVAGSPAPNFTKTGETPFYDCSNLRPLEPEEAEELFEGLMGGARQVGGEIQKPEKVEAKQPQYTESARKARVQGVVITQAVIDTEGTVPIIKILEGLPEGLNEEAIKAICSWRFSPARLADEPVAVYYQLTVNFRLQ